MRNRSVQLTRIIVVVWMMLVPVGLSAVSPKAAELLAKAEELHNKTDDVGAMQAYLDAVKADPAAEDLMLIERYGRPGTGFDAEWDRQARLEAPLMNQALLSYSSHHPDEFFPVSRLIESYTFIGQESEARKTLSAFLARRPYDIDARHSLVRVLVKAGEYSEAVAAQEQTAAHYPCDPRELSEVAIVVREVAPKVKERPDLLGDLLNRAEVAARKAASMEPEDSMTLAGVSAVLRARAETADDAKRAAALKQQGDELAGRVRAMHQQDTDPAKHPRPKWFVDIRQPGKLDHYLQTVRWSVAYIRREPFQIEIKEPGAVPIRVTIAGEDRIAHTLPDDALVSKKPWGAGTVLTYSVGAVKGIAIPQTKDCRFYVTVTRNDEKIAIPIEPE